MPGFLFIDDCGFVDFINTIRVIKYILLGRPLYENKIFQIS